MELTDAERSYLEAARLGRLATVDADERPHVVPVCYAVLPDHVVSPIDEKPKTVGPDDLRRVRNVHTNPRVALVVDHYAEDWSRLGWLQIRGRASVREPGADSHGPAVTALREKYHQYHDHALAERPMLAIEPDQVRSWGTLDPAAVA